MPVYTVKEYAQHWEISERRVRQLLKGKRIRNCKKMGRDWVIGSLEQYTIFKRGKDKKPRRKGKENQKGGRNETD